MDCVPGLQKAFDSRVVAKLDFQADIRGTLLQWIDDYLMGREQQQCRVKLD